MVAIKFKPVKIDENPMTKIPIVIGITFDVLVVE